MKKLTLISTLIAVMLAIAACGNKKTTSNGSNGDHHNAQNSLDWMGTYTNDTITLFLEEQGVCRTVRADGSTDGEYVWDVDGSTILVTEITGKLTMYKVCEDYLVSHTGSRLNKISK